MAGAEQARPDLAVELAEHARLAVEGAAELALEAGAGDLQRHRGAVLVARQVDLGVDDHVDRLDDLEVADPLAGRSEVEIGWASFESAASSRPSATKPRSISKALSSVSCGSSPSSLL